MHVHVMHYCVVWCDHECKTGIQLDAENAAVISPVICTGDRVALDDRENNGLVTINTRGCEGSSSITPSWSDQRCLLYVKELLNEVIHSLYLLTRWTETAVGLDAGPANPWIVSQHCAKAGAVCPASQTFVRLIKSVIKVDMGSKQRQRYRHDHTVTQ